MRRKLLSSAVATALAIPAAAHAVSTSWYGHLDRAIQFIDDGVSSDVTFVDNTASSSRMGWVGTEEVSNGVTAGARVEYDFRSNTVFSTGGKINGTDASDTALRIRKAEVFFSGGWGKLTLGQSSDATDSVAYANHNDAFEGTYVEHDWGLVSFRGSNGAVLNATPYAIFSSYDGGRRDLVRYDTKSMGPLRAAVSAGTNGRLDAAAYFAADVGGGSLVARVGYARLGGSSGPSIGSEPERLLGSASYQFSQGTFSDSPHRSLGGYGPASV